MLFEFQGRRPRVHPDAYVAPTAVLIGDVELEAGASVWFGAILRGDTGKIRIGERSNVQDNTVIHVSNGTPTLVGADVTIGHAAVMEGCVVEDGALVGMGSIMLPRSRLGRCAMLAAGSVLTEGADVPPGHLAAGIPARVKGEISAATAERWIGSAADHYRAKAAEYRESLRQID